MKEEINFEQELYKHFGHVKDFTLCTAIAKKFYEIGRNHQESISEELEEAALMHFKDVMEYEIKTGHKMAHMTSFKAGAKWQKNKMMEDAVDGVVAASAGGDGWVNIATGFVKSEDVNVKFGDKIKIIVVKED